MHEELLFFCRAFWAGACLAAGYDLLRIFRRLVSHSPFLTGAEDILYWCCAGIYLFGMIYRENDGFGRMPFWPCSLAALSSMQVPEAFW